MKNIQYKKILVTHDGSKNSASALPHAFAIAKSCDSEIVLLKVINSVAQETAVMHTHALYQLGAFEDIAHETVKKNRTKSVHELEKIKLLFTSYGIKNITIKVSEGSTPDVILDTANSEKCDLIVMATHGRSGIGRVIIGSVADHVIRHATCPVLVVHPKKGGK